MNKRVWWYKRDTFCQERLTGVYLSHAEDESYIRVRGDDGKLYRVRPSALRWE